MRNREKVALEQLKKVKYALDLIDTTMYHNGSKLHLWTAQVGVCEA